MLYFKERRFRNLFRPVKIVFFYVMVLFGIFILFFHNLFISENYYNVDEAVPNLTKNTMHFIQHQVIVDNFMEKREEWRMSNLGSILFLDKDPNAFIKPKNENKIFTVFIWKYFKMLETRHIKNFGNHRNPQTCSVTNCEFSGDDSTLSSADAVVVHLQRGEIPTLNERRPDQRWIFLSDEAPPNTFSLAKNKNWSRLSNIFNWSMTFRSDSDIPVPYGRVVSLKLPKAFNTSIKEIIPNWTIKRRDVLVAILISNCLKSRMNFIEKLSKYVEVHIYGSCSKQFNDSCPGHFRTDCKPIGDYLFYLVFENGKCKEYLTEKSFHHAYFKGAIPIIMGPTLDDCETFLPPASFMHVDNYPTHKSLATAIKDISNNENKLLSYHEWRVHFEAQNEHGYFGTASKHFCRICEALNYNDDSPKIYDREKLKLFLDPSSLCDRY